MRNITFISSLNSTFASKWKEKLVPLEVAYGKLLQNDYAVSKREKTQNNYVSGRLEKDKEGFQNQARRTRKNYKIDKTPVISENYDDRIYKSGGKQSISATGREKLQQMRSAYKKRKLTATIGKAKNFISNNRLGIGAVGLAATGALAYGLARKIRSDKGKKRK